MSNQNSVTIDDLAIMIKAGFDDVGEKLVQHDQMFAKIDMRFDKIESDITSFRMRFDKIESDIASFRMELRQEINKLSDRISGVEKMLSEDISAAYQDIKMLKVQFSEFEKKLNRLELAQNRKN